MEKLIFRAKNWPRLIRRVGLLAGKYGKLDFSDVFPHLAVNILTLQH